MRLDTETRSSQVHRAGTTSRSLRISERDYYTSPFLVFAYGAVIRFGRIFQNAVPIEEGAQA